MKLVPRRVHGIAAWLVRIEALFLFSLGAYLLIRTLTSSVEELDAVVADQYVSAHTVPGKSPLAGNSVGMDRNFIARDMHKLNGYLHLS